MKTHSKPALMGVAVIGRLIRMKRLERRMTAEDLAERAGFSRGLLHRIENGDPGCSVGAVFEAASILGVAPFDQANTLNMAFNLAQIGRELDRMPRSAHLKRPRVSDDF